MKIGAIVQARYSSTRLPGKILKELPSGSGITVLDQVIRRLKRSKKINEIIVSTSLEKSADRILAVAKREGVGYFRGSKENVLSRYYLSAKRNNLDLIVRICSDCPCIDPGVIDSVIEKHIKKNADYTSNTLERTYPRGLDTEVFNFDILEKTYKNAKKKYEKEHVTPYICENPTLFKISPVTAPKKLYGPDIRITLDTNEDYALLCAVYSFLYTRNKYFTASDIIRLFKKKPWLKLINKNVIQKKVSD
ncbi:MAG: glycosyltransferase family protein [Candidatus Omnitrophota bacterium]|nr:MAG: glycosyltransferase family protein [Candidatus Omnitrophota bacterium]